MPIAASLMNLEIIKLSEVRERRICRAVVSDSVRPMDCSLQALLCPWDSPGKNTGGVAILFSRGSSQPREWTWVSCIAERFFTVWATREAPYPMIYYG